MERAKCARDRALHAIEPAKRVSDRAPHAIDRARIARDRALHAIDRAPHMLDRANARSSACTARNRTCAEHPVTVQRAFANPQKAFTARAAGIRVPAKSIQ